MCASVRLGHCDTVQLHDASKNKFSKCEHIDLDWGVGVEGEEEIYQTPVPLQVDSATAGGGGVSHVPPPSMHVMKRSDTSGNLSDRKGMRLSSLNTYDSPSPPEPALPPRSPIINGGAGRRRPMSTYQLETHSPRSSPLPPSSSQPHSILPHLSPTGHLNSDPTKSDPAPPPPPRTLSKHADPVHKYVLNYVSCDPCDAPLVV